MNATPTTAIITILGRSEDGSISIEIEDPSSGIRVFTARLTAEQFMTRLCGRANMEEIDCTWAGLDRMGAQRCNMRLFVKSKSELARVTRGIATLVGGTWVANESDFGNHHRRRGDGYLVTFVGWLDPSVDSDAAIAKIKGKYGEGST